MADSWRQEVIQSLRRGTAYWHDHKTHDHWWHHPQWARLFFTNHQLIKFPPAVFYGGIFAIQVLFFQIPLACVKLTKKKDTTLFLSTVFNKSYFHLCVCYLLVHWQFINCNITLEIIMLYHSILNYSQILDER